MFERPRASPRGRDVADPAVGTGTFLLGVLRRIAATVRRIRARARSRRDRGRGQAHHRLRNPVGPFAVAQLRLIAEMQTLMKQAAAARAPTLHHRHARQSLHRGGATGADLRADREIAARCKQGQEGGTDHSRHRQSALQGESKGRGGWIEEGTNGRAPLDAAWMPPAEWGVGAHAKHLKNLYVYFWRGRRGRFRLRISINGTAGKDEDGVVCFITSPAFSTGPAFRKCATICARSCIEIWVIDCSPEGHQPDVPTRFSKASSSQSALCSRRAH